MLCQNACDVPLGTTATVSDFGPRVSLPRPQAARTSSSGSNPRILCVITLQPPEPLRISTEDGLLLVRRARRQVLEYDPHRAPVRGGDEADRPVRSDHQALPPEGIERHLQVRPELRVSPILPVRFGDQSRQLGEDVRMAREPADVPLP